MVHAIMVNLFILYGQSWPDMHRIAITFAIHMTTISKNAYLHAFEELNALLLSVVGWGGRKSVRARRDVIEERRRRKPKEREGPHGMHAEDFIQGGPTAEMEVFYMLIERCHTTNR